MAKYKIYSKDGKTVRYEGAPRFSSSYMGVDFLEFPVYTSSPIDWQIGDYVLYDRTGIAYSLYNIPHPKKISQKHTYGAAFQYNVILYSPTKELEIAPFRDVVANDNAIHFSTRKDFSTYEDVYGIAKRIQSSLDDLYPGKWEIEVVKTADEQLSSLLNEVKDFQCSGDNCLSILSKIYDLWKNVGWIHRYDNISGKNIIIIGGANVRLPGNTTKQFSYGKGNGLISIRKADAKNDEFITRLYVYGSERNIQTRYYNKQNILNKDSADIANLMIPIEKWGLTNGLPDARKAYIQADDAIIAKYGVRPRTIYFDGSENEDIYPSVQGLTMNQIRQEMIASGQGGSPFLPSETDIRVDKVGYVNPNAFHSGSKVDTEKNKIFEIGIPLIGFDLVEQGRLTQDGYAVISMKTGKCAGREFKVRKKKNPYNLSEGAIGYNYELIMEWDESIGMGFPNRTYPIESGDEYVILNIPMPDFYITIAEKKLFSRGEKMLKDYTSVSAFYEPVIDPIQMVGYKLFAGMYMAIKDEDIIDTPDNVDYVLIDTLSIDENTDIPKYDVTLREQKRSSRSFSAIEDMIEDAKQESIIEDEKNKRYVNRRFQDAQETISMLQGAFKNFSESISPITIQAMHLLVGDARQQFIFTENLTSSTAIHLKYSYDSASDSFQVMKSFIKHMTLGINSISSFHRDSEYRRWEIPEAHSQLKSGVPYYLYIKASKTTNYGYFLFSEVVCEDTETDYLLLSGIINSNFDGQRSFAPMNGYTEIKPGQIVTEILRSSSGQSYIDLLTGNMALGNKLKFRDGNLTIDCLFANGADIGGWVFNNGRLESKKRDFNDNPIAFLDGSNGEARLSGVIQLSTGYEGKISDKNIYYLPSVSLPAYLTMGHNMGDIGKVCKLFNSSPYGGGSYTIRIGKFGIVNGTYKSIGVERTVDLPPQGSVEITCFELPKNQNGEIYDIVGYWEETNRWSYGRKLVKTIRDTSSMSDRRLTTLDETILIDCAKSTTIYLPKDPGEGKEYTIIFTGSTLDIQHILSSSTANICWPSANEFDVGSTTMGNRGAVIATYIKDKSGKLKWWVTRHE